MKRRTIAQAIIEALKREEKPARVQEVYKRIIEDDLYRFRSASPEHIVRTALRRHSENLEFPSAKKKKHFTQIRDGRYWLKNTPSIEHLPEEKKEKITSEFSELKFLHHKYLQSFKHSILNQLKVVDPTTFEEFCKELLKAYGFKNLKVTRATKDGGIDGFGELKIGLAAMSVAFECKRWSSSVGRPKVSQFRGDIQGKYQQGIYFTTASFTNEAKAVSLQQGAVPVILIDGVSIVEIMIEKKLGIEVEELPIYTNALDMVLKNESSE